MKRRGFLPLELTVLLYFLSYLPNILLTKLATSEVHPDRGRPLTGLETLPSTLSMNLVLTYAFIWLSGWYRDAHSRPVGSVRVPQYMAVERYSHVMHLVSRVESELQSNGYGAEKQIEELTSALQRERAERAMAEGALETGRRDLARLLREVASLQQDRNNGELDPRFFSAA